MKSHERYPALYQFHNSIVNLRWKLKGLAKYAVNDLINAFFQINASLIDTTSTLLKRSKIISYIQLLAWLTRLCVFRLIVQCQVQSKDRLTIATQKPWARILTSVLGFERAIWISWRPRRNNWWSGYSAILKLSSLDIFSKSLLLLLCFLQFWE